MERAFWIAALDVAMDVVEHLKRVVEGLCLSADYEDDSVALLQDHLLVRRSLIEIVIAWEVIKLEQQVLDLQIVAFDPRGRLQHFCLLGIKLIEDDLNNGAFSRFGQPHDADIHGYNYETG